MTSDKELIEQLAKSHAFIFWQVPKIGYTYSFTEAQLEAFAKAYAQTQGQSKAANVSERDKYPEKCNQTPFHCSYPECGCGR